MSGKNVDEIIQQGIHGQKELKPEERKRFLGTIRERIIAVLTQPQVRDKEVYHEFLNLMKKHPQALLFANGNMEYASLKKYIEAARVNKIPYKMVINKDYNTDIGLVLAYEYAIDKEEIFLEKKVTNLEVANVKEKGSLAKLASWLREKRHEVKGKSNS
ncbi:YueI family protein [Bacillus cihuensis]|uniref:YueI family protein n=1 Tax=Bacillus cihuensis TaxID=1208599 RepID=UPI000408F18A|nr:YueI family protein [Bacillus cihuensis]